MPQPFKLKKRNINLKVPGQLEANFNSSYFGQWGGEPEKPNKFIKVTNENNETKQIYSPNMQLESPLHVQSFGNNAQSLSETQSINAN